MTEETTEISLTVNGEAVTRAVPVRRHLVDFLRIDLDLTGSHLACEHGVCGACTVRVDGVIARGCLMLAVQANGSQVRTVEGLAPDAQTLHPLQQAFSECHGLQCGYCTPGMLMSSLALLAENPDPSVKDIRKRLAGNICRCTGYQNIIKSVQSAAKVLQEG